MGRAIGSTREEIKAYEGELRKRGGDPVAMTFYQDYFSFHPEGGGRGTKNRAQFSVIYNRDANGNELNRQIVRIIGFGRKGYIPTIARPGVIPVFRGFSDLYKGGFVKVALPDKWYDFYRGYDRP